MDQRTDSAVAPPVPAAFAVMHGLLDELSERAGVWRLSDEQVGACVDDAYRLVHRLQAWSLALVGEADQRGLARAAGAPSTKAWVQHRQRLRPEQAKRDVALVDLLPRPDQGDGTAPRREGEVTGAALAAGDISIVHAHVVAKALTELPEDLPSATRLVFEAEMVAYARMVDPRELTIFGHHLLERIDPGAADRELAKRLEREEREARRKRSASRYADGHGSVFYKLRVSESDDTGIWPVLDSLARPQPSGEGGRDERTGGQRLADAFVETFRRVSLDGGLPDNGGDRPRVVVMLGLAELVTGLGAGTNMDTGAVLSPETVRRLACDAQIIPAVLGGAGQVLELGHARRTFTGPVRLSVIIRDGGCVHPGCDRPPRWCDVHHVIPWWRGGETNPGNGVLLCGFHHRLYDDGTWTVRFADDGLPEAVPPAWIDPEQTPIRHARFLTRRQPRAA